METPRQRFASRLGQLKKLRAPWDDRYRDIGDYLLPWRVSFGANDTQKRTPSDKILDPTGTYALRTCAAGMSAGFCSPARRWKRITAPTPALARRGPVKAYIDVVDQVIDLILLRSGFYGVTSGAVFPDLIAFATHGLLSEEDTRIVARWKPMPVGQYWLAANADGDVDTSYREFQLTVSQLASEFGLEACSALVRDQYRRGQFDVFHKVMHVVEENRRDEETGFEGRRSGRWNWEGMAYRSVWMESTCGAGDDRKFLRTAGYREFPVIAPRWSRTQPEDVYGTGPAFEALPDVKQLQTMKRRLLQMIEKQSSPPLSGPDILKAPSQLPGTYTAVPHGTEKVSAIYVPDHGAVEQVRNEIRGLQYSIKEGLYADLWRVITDDQRAQPATAEEIRGKREERLLQLGPVGVNVEQEFFRKVIDRTYNLANRAGYLPPPPPELDGVDLKVEFLSIMSDAQKAQQIPAIERTAAFILSLSQLDPDVLDSADGDKFAERYAEISGLPPDLMRTPEGREARRKAKAMAAQAAQQMEALSQGAGAARDLAGASLESDNGLSRILASMPPGVSAQAGGGMSAPLGPGVPA